MTGNLRCLLVFGDENKSMELILRCHFLQNRYLGFFGERLEIRSGYEPAICEELVADRRELPGSQRLRNIRYKHSLM